MYSICIYAYTHAYANISIHIYIYIFIYLFICLHVHICREKGAPLFCLYLFRSKPWAMGSAEPVTSGGKCPERSAKNACRCCYSSIFVSDTSNHFKLILVIIEAPTVGTWKLMGLSNYL